MNITRTKVQALLSKILIFYVLNLSSDWNSPSMIRFTSRFKLSLTTFIQFMLTYLIYLSGTIIPTWMLSRQHNPLTARIVSVQHHNQMILNNATRLKLYESSKPVEMYTKGILHDNIWEWRMSQLPAQNIHGIRSPGRRHLCKGWKRYCHCVIQQILIIFHTVYKMNHCYQCY